MSSLDTSSLRVLDHVRNCWLRTSIFEAYLTSGCVQAIYESVSEVAEDPKMVRKAMKSQAQCASKEERCEILQVKQRLREQSSVCANMIERQRGRGKETETRA